MNVADTNVWIYYHDARDPAKQAAASNVIDTVRPLVLPRQVGCEFIAASRKLRPFGFTGEMASQALGAMQDVAALIALPNPSIGIPHVNFRDARCSPSGTPCSWRTAFVTA